VAAEQVGTAEFPSMGFFNWNVAENILTGDHIFAAVYGFDVERASAGLLVEEILATMVEADKPRVAREIHSAIINGHFTTNTYQIYVRSRLKTVMAFGRCMRDPFGVPSYFVGAVMEVGEDDITDFLTTFLVPFSSQRPTSLHLATNNGLSVAPSLAVEKSERENTGTDQTYSNRG